MLPATVEHLDALSRDAPSFSALIGSPVPAGWPEFPEAVDFTLARLRHHPDEFQWWMHLFLADGVLVGSGGYVGPPVDATVEIGYEIAPAFRGRGLATAAARALIVKAGEQVTTVLAHTAPAESASTGVLRRLGFRLSREVPHDELGIAWRWELATSHPPAG